jgi:hypothetical protein
MSYLTLQHGNTNMHTQTYICTTEHKAVTCLLGLLVQLLLQADKLAHIVHVHDASLGHKARCSREGKRYNPALLGLPHVQRLDEKIR